MWFLSVWVHYSLRIEIASSSKIDWNYQQQCNFNSLIGIRCHVFFQFFFIVSSLLILHNDLMCVIVIKQQWFICYSKICLNLSQKSVSVFLVPWKEVLAITHWVAMINQIPINENCLRVKWKLIAIINCHILIPSWIRIRWLYHIVAIHLT